ncbi:cyclic lactone autoinducer peptide [Clostridium pasteurianum]|nr:cyclic lactone autoinducer peptide [Clostridium pasteurianum]
MKNTLKKNISVIFKRTAFSTSASACTFSFYQPKEPKCLQKK